MVVFEKDVMIMVIFWFQLWDIDLLSNVGSHDTSSFSLATTPAKLMKLCVSSTPAPSPASSYCKTPNT